MSDAVLIPPRPPTKIRTSSIAGKVLWNTDPVPGSQAVLKARGDYYSLPVLKSMICRPDGTFTLRNVAPGDYELYAVAPEGGEYWEWSGREVTVPPLTAVEAGTLYLSKKMQLVAPESPSDVRTATPTLYWHAFPGTAYYDVAVFNDTTGVRVFLERTTGTDAMVSPALAAGTRYQWSVYASAASGIQIAYYSAWAFTHAA